MAGDDKKIIARNRRALHDYAVFEKYQCGIVLKGSEVKSLREGKVALNDAYGEVREGEVWLVDCHISEYPQAGIFNHKPKRDRKLLLRKQEIKKLHARVNEKGFTLIPLSIYFLNGMAKIELAVCKGKRKYEKREILKKKEIEREIKRLRRQ